MRWLSWAPSLAVELLEIGECLRRESLLFEGFSICKFPMPQWMTHTSILWIAFIGFSELPFYKKGTRPPHREGDFDGENRRGLERTRKHTALWTNSMHCEGFIDYELGCQPCYQHRNQISMCNVESPFYFSVRQNFSREREPEKKKGDDMRDSVQEVLSKMGLSSAFFCCFGGKKKASNLWSAGWCWKSVSCPTSANMFTACSLWWRKVVAWHSQAFWLINYLKCQRKRTWKDILKQRNFLSWFRI